MSIRMMMNTRLMMVIQVRLALTALRTTLLKVAVRILPKALPTLRAIAGIVSSP